MLWLDSFSNTTEAPLHKASRLIWQHSNLPHKRVCMRAFVFIYEGEGGVRKNELIREWQLYFCRCNSVRRQFHGERPALRKSCTLPCNCSRYRWHVTKNINLKAAREHLCSLFFKKWSGRARGWEWLIMFTSLRQSGAVTVEKFKGATLNIKTKPQTKVNW